MLLLYALALNNSPTYPAETWQSAAIFTTDFHRFSQIEIGSIITDYLG